MTRIAGWQDLGCQYIASDSDVTAIHMSGDEITSRVVLEVVD